MFGQYQILAKLGEGGMGVVYKARDTKLNREVALKLPKFDEKKLETQAKRFQREVQTMLELDHPNITKIYDVGVIRKQPFCSMQLIQGVTLKDLQNKIKINQLIQYIISVCNALEYAHSCGFIHRDIKPSNIMIDERNHVYVMDFGLVKVQKNSDRSITKTAEICGTLHYMSPEQARGNKSLDARADIFSLGATLYEMITGTTPFGGSDQMNILFNLVGNKKEAVAPQSIVKKLHSDLSYICQKAVKRKPNDRYQSIANFRDDLEKFQNGEKLNKSFDFSFARKVALPISISLILFSIVAFFLAFFSNSQQIIHAKASAREYKERFEKAYESQAVAEKRLDSEKEKFEKTLEEIKNLNSVSIQNLQEASIKLLRDETEPVRITRMRELVEQTWEFFKKAESFDLITEEQMAYVIKKLQPDEFLKRFSADELEKKKCPSNIFSFTHYKLLVMSVEIPDDPKHWELVLEQADILYLAKDYQLSAIYYQKAFILGRKSKNPDPSKMFDAGRMSKKANEHYESWLIEKKLFFKE